ncbi:methyltransferase domain-containing protein [Clostridium sp. 'deep sea']|uniref:class I SAM-dependent methyltransferase n=1 Tax=Clostridium sp. 'deep sea' TaxID=2779445 RepID=UPI0018967BAD|nr:class I SAM-dependent methyltransferase [Clostridium sp. 'deep sea']QOR35511.1 methyltransferase domain-containing protein [Clostridium sp. 'deep sea']
MKEINITSLLSYGVKPKLFTKGEIQFWQDSHIAKGMLQAHLNQDTNAASYKLSKIREIVDFITKTIRLQAENKILDCGCGPGLYCELFSKKLLNVTGVDISPNSIAYARQSANKQNLNIKYECNDYLSLSYKREFEAALIIWQDFCVLNNNERNIFLQNIYNALKPLGYFVLDVSTPNIENENTERSSWSVYKTGFWSEKEHLVLENLFFYNNKKIRLKQYVVIEKDRERVFRIYQQHYEPQELTNILKQNGFNVIHCYEDLTGKPYTKNSKTMAIIAQKIM